MTEIGIHRGGPPETVLPEAEPAAVDALAKALELADVDQRREAISAVVADHPKFLDGWARLGELGRHPIERYAAFRVGYHRGLDTARQSGWRGSGYIRWENPTNRGFLRAVAGLQAAAAEIGEADEELRCSQFLRQLDPTWPPPEFN